MKAGNFLYLFLSLTFSWSSISCTSEASDLHEATTPSKNRILNLGASRVEGGRPDFESYRYELWKNLKADQWTFDFIGTQEDLSNYPAFGPNFDRDHEGYGGWTSSQLRARLPSSLARLGSPDLVLFSSPAGNDLLQGQDLQKSLENINAIIDVFQAANPKVIVLLEQMAPAKSDFMNASMTQALNQMHQAIAQIAQAQSTADSIVMAIDMFTGFSDALLADDVHYNNDGAMFIADRYYQALQSLLVN
jgi:hypothetical protein